MSFETAADLDLVVSDQALRQVRGQIESELGAIEIGATDGGTMSAQSAQSGSGGSRRQRQTLRMERTQTEHLEDIALYLESIDDVLSEGGLLGGGGGLPGSGIFAEVVGAGAETAGDVGVEAGDAVADAVSDVLTGTVSTALGTSISSAINDSTVAVEPNPLPVEDEGSGGDTVTVSPDVRFSPTIKPTFEPDLGPDINLPDLNLGIPDTLAVNRDPLPVQRDPLPVEDVGPIPVEEVPSVAIDISTRGTGSTATTSGQSSSNRSLDELFDDSLESAGRGGATGAALGAVGGAAGGGVGAIPGAVAGGVGGTIVGAGTPFVLEGASRIGSALGDGQGPDRPSPPAQNITVEVDRSPTYNTTIDPSRLDDLADRIVSAIEEDIERELDELRSDVDDVERDIEELERDITRGR